MIRFWIYYACEFNYQTQIQITDKEPSRKESGGRQKLVILGELQTRKKVANEQRL